MAKHEGGVLKLVSPDRWDLSDFLQFVEQMSDNSHNQVARCLFCETRHRKEGCVVVPFSAMAQEKTPTKDLIGVNVSPTPKQQAASVPVKAQP
jgi:hypothetical protein